jgi:type VI secretion system secreted protein Hcp
MGEMFLKLDGVVGESLDEASPKSHKNEIEIKAWSWVTTNDVKWDINQGGQSTKVHVQDVVIDKVCDAATVTLYQFCVTGKHFKSATITCRKNNGDQKLEYLILELTDVMVTSVQFAGSGDDQFLPEKVQLSFAQYKLTYQTQQDLGGSAGSKDFGYNIQKMKAA